MAAFMFSVMIDLDAYSLEICHHGPGKSRSSLWRLQMCREDDPST